MWSASIGALPALVENFETVYKATVADLAVADPVTTAGVSVGFKTAGWLAKLLKRPDDADWLRDFKFSSEGRFYYNFHNVLCALTRPGKRVEAIGKLKLSPNARINFVIFIDDLDRCLPEKAVETLELIKTVFNLESFAFVLALDEEVVERGIGHRYKDYALVNKKPEMPITGFEYLEKIVHLPFRLPALSRQEGLKFLEEYERSFLEGRKRHLRAGYEPLPWFSERDFPVALPDKLQVRSDPMAGAKGAAEAAIEAWSARSAVTASGGMLGCHLGRAVLNAFDAYWPRKLIRVVELFHQELEVAHERGRPVDAHLGGARDPRWVLTFAMLQLFQPDLYRLLRRQGRGIDILRDSFEKGHLRANMADMDLLAWGCYQTQPVADRSSALGLIRDIEDDPGKRYPAERLRLPIVDCLLEHRAAQRHVFDLFKLLAALKDDRAPFADATTQSYFGLLGKTADEADVLSAQAVYRLLAAMQPVGDPSDCLAQSDVPAGGASDVEVDVESLFTTLTSAEPSERQSLASFVGLTSGQKLARQLVSALILRVTAWLGASDGADRIERLQRLQDGLYYLGKVCITSSSSPRCETVTA